MMEELDNQALYAYTAKLEKEAMMKGLLSIREKHIRHKVEIKSLITSVLDHWQINIPDKLFLSRTGDIELLKNIEIVEPLKDEIISKYKMVEFYDSKIKELDSKIMELSVSGTIQQATRIPEAVPAVG